MTVNALSYTAESTTLESVRLQLENWRSTRVKGNPIPKPLWEAIRDLTEHYPYRRIASRLKINIYRLRAKMEEQSVSCQQACVKGSSLFYLNKMHPFTHAC